MFTYRYLYIHLHPQHYQQVLDSAKLDNFTDSLNSKRKSSNFFNFINDIPFLIYIKNLIVKMKLKRFFEFKKSDLEPVKSFKIQDELNPKIWDDMKMKKEIREDLLKISEDFFEGTELDAEVKDIILTGSLANYNWSKYSDHDLHIIIDFKDINDDEDLVKDLVDSKKTIWNLQHDIKIGGYEVEVYIQDEKEPHTSTGVYSILNDKWNVKPKKVDFEPNEKEIEKKGVSIMKQVDKIEEDWENLEYEEVKKRVKKVWEKIKKLRKDGLKKGEFGTGNLVFKLLRRNNYIGKIMDIKKNAYEKQFEPK